MGLAAPINKRTGELEADGILPGWHGIRPARRDGARLGLPVQLENDANVGALGEKVFGAGTRRRRPDLRPALRGRRRRADPRRPAVPRRARCRRRDRPRARARARADLPLRQPRLPGDRRQPRRGRGAARAQHRPAVSVADLLGSSRTATGAHGAPSRTRARRSAAARRCSSTSSTRSWSSSAASSPPPATCCSTRSAPRSSGTACCPRPPRVRVIAGTLGDRAEVLGAAALILAQSPRALARRVEQ